MIRNEKAVALAKDVIKHIQGFRRIAQGTYIEGILPATAGVDEDAQKHIDKIQATCEVCALGACFISYVRLFDDVTMGDMAIYDDDQVNHRLVNNGGEFSLTLVNFKDKLLEVFSERQLQLIESSFECELMGVDEEADENDGEEWSPEIRAAIEFGESYPQSDERLKAIMKNIIKHGGIFSPLALVAA